MRYILGLDLGQTADPTALAVLERIVLPITPDEKRRAPPLVCRYECRHLERLRLGTPYPDVVAHVAALLEQKVLAEAQTALVVDATGVGAPVVDMFMQADLNPVAITITGGDTVTREWSNFRVPKRDLVGVVQVLLQSERMQFAAELPSIPQLVQEFLAFRVKIDPLTAHDSYGAWRDGTHDDLVLAVAIAAWYGEQWRPPLKRRTGLGSVSYPLYGAPLSPPAPGPYGRGSF